MRKKKYLDNIKILFYIYDICSYWYNFLTLAVLSDIETVYYKNDIYFFKLKVICQSPQHGIPSYDIPRSYNKHLTYHHTTQQGKKTIANKYSSVYLYVYENVYYFYFDIIEFFCI